MPSYYLNTDLYLTSPGPLDKIAESISDACEIMHNGPVSDALMALTACAKDSGDLNSPTTPQQDVVALIAALEQLPGPAKAQLLGCTEKLISIGWQSAETRPEGAFALTPQILSRIASLGLTLNTTIYPSEENDLDLEDLR